MQIRVRKQGVQYLYSRSQYEFIHGEDAANNRNETRCHLAVSRDPTPTRDLSPVIRRDNNRSLARSRAPARTLDDITRRTGMRARRA